MTEQRIDHTATAIANLTNILQGKPGDAADASVVATISQAHATLALVAEQRLANQIAYVQLLESQYAEAAKHGTEFDWDTRADSNVRHGIVLDRIREGLGL